MRETGGSTPAESAYFVYDDETDEVVDVQSYATESWH